MSQPFGVPYEQWRLVNVMLPRQYYPPLQVGGEGGRRQSSYLPSSMIMGEAILCVD